MDKNKNGAFFVLFLLNCLERKVCLEKLNEASLTLEKKKFRRKKCTQHPEKKPQK